MKKLSMDTKLTLAAFAGTFAVVVAMGLRTPAGGETAQAGARQAAAVGPAALAAGPMHPPLVATGPHAPAGQGTAEPVPVVPVAPAEPTPREVIEADPWAVAEAPNNNY